MFFYSRANNEIDKVKTSYEAEITGLQAAVKRGQMGMASLEKQIEQKVRNCTTTLYEI